MRNRSPHPSMAHCNGHLVCAVDVETTGLNPFIHELWQIAVVPLDQNLEPLDINPFYISVTPKNKEKIDWTAIEVSRARFMECQKFAMDSWKAVDLFEEWFKGLGLPLNKKILAIASNWCFDRDFLIQWMGYENFGYHFSGHSRDTQTAAIFLNDRRYEHNSPIVTPHVGVKDLSKHYDVLNVNPHDALSDAVTSARIYRAQMKAYTPILPQSTIDNAIKQQDAARLAANTSATSPPAGDASGGQLPG